MATVRLISAANPATADVTPFFTLYNTAAAGRFRLFVTTDEARGLLTLVDGTETRVLGYFNNAGTMVGFLIFYLRFPVVHYGFGNGSGTRQQRLAAIRLTFEHGMLLAEQQGYTHITGATLKPANDIGRTVVQEMQDRAVTLGLTLVPELDDGTYLHWRVTPDTGLRLLGVR